MLPFFLFSQLIPQLVKFISVTASELKDDERLVAAMAATVQESLSWMFLCMGRFVFPVAHSPCRHKDIRRAQADLERESEERMFEEVCL